MKADSHYMMGRGKIICQDYALTGEGFEKTFAIGADGCSSSKNSQTGAILLAQRTKALIKQCQCGSSGSAETLEKNLRLFLIESIISLGWQLVLDKEAFDTSLWLILCSENRAQIVGWGDGYIVINYNDKMSIEKIEYESGAPYYLNYQSSPHRTERYLKDFPGKIIQTTKIFQDDSIINSSHYYPVEIPYTRNINLSDGIQSISILSDGLGTYFDRNNAMAPEQDIVRELTTYKNTNGEFVKKRMINGHRKLASKGINHFDDIFCSTILLEGDNYVKNG